MTAACSTVQLSSASITAAVTDSNIHQRHATAGSNALTWWQAPDGLHREEPDRLEAKPVTAARKVDFGTSRKLPQRAKKGHRKAQALKVHCTDTIGQNGCPSVRALNSSACSGNLKVQFKRRLTITVVAARAGQRAGVSRCVRKRLLKLQDVKAVAKERMCSSARYIHSPATFNYVQADVAPALQLAIAAAGR